MLVELIDTLYNDIGTGLNDAKIRSRLDSIREEAEAVEASMKAAQARVKELEANLQTQNVAPKQDVLEEGDNNLLRALFKFSGRASLERIARALQLSNSKAEYHLDRLKAAGMIESAGIITRDGHIFLLTPKGRAYVVENELAE